MYSISLLYSGKWNAYFLSYSQVDPPSNDFDRHARRSGSMLLAVILPSLPPPTRIPGGQAEGFSTSRLFFSTPCGQTDGISLFCFFSLRVRVAKPKGVQHFAFFQPTRPGSQAESSSTCRSSGTLTGMLSQHLPGTLPLNQLYDMVRLFFLVSELTLCSMSLTCRLSSHLVGEH